LIGLLIISSIAGVTYSLRPIRTELTPLPISGPSIDSQRHELMTKFPTGSWETGANGETFFLYSNGAISGLPAEIRYYPSTEPAHGGKLSLQMTAEYFEVKSGATTTRGSQATVEELCSRSFSHVKSMLAEKLGEIMLHPVVEDKTTATPAVFIDQRCIDDPKTWRCEGNTRTKSDVFLFQRGKPSATLRKEMKVIEGRSHRVDNIDVKDKIKYLRRCYISLDLMN
jgi:hypothetical protein